MNNIPNEIPNFSSSEEKSYATILGDIGSTAKDIFVNDLALVVSEVKLAQKKIASESKHVAVFGLITLLGVFPLLAFLILIIGQALGNYWLSSLIVGALFSIIGMIGLLAAFKKIKDIDLEFAKTKAAIKKEGEAIFSQVSKIQDAVKGERRAQ
jgi:hypothetical protein